MATGQDARSPPSSPLSVDKLGNASAPPSFANPSPVFDQEELSRVGYLINVLFFWGEKK